MYHKLFCFLLSVVVSTILTEGERLNDHISYYEPLALTASYMRSTKDKLTAKFDFKAHGRVFVLNLKTHSSLFHPNFYLEVIGDQGRERKSLDMKHIVSGSIQGEEESLVHGRISENSFDGIIHSKKESYHIDLLDYHPSVAQSSQIRPVHNRVIYKARDVEYDKFFSKCTSGNSSRLRLIQQSALSSGGVYDRTTLSDALRKKRQSDNRNTCTVRVVADNRFFENVGQNSEKYTVDEMSLHILEADRIYRDTDFKGDEGDIIKSRLSIHSSVIFNGNEASNPLFGDYNVEELLQAFSEENLDDVCLGHLFTYRDFQGTIGLAYLGDPNGQYGGGICQKRTRTIIGEVNLNTGLTTFLNFGMRLSRAVSTITVAHEIGHNHGSEHDLSGECYDGKYIMYPYATTGNKQEFSSCSKSSIGRTINAQGNCFIPFPHGGVCGNGIVEPNEECDCGETMNQTLCFEADPCCLVNCTLREGANCSSHASACCDPQLCQPLNDISVVCLKGDIELEGGGCQNDTFCEEDNPNCPPPTHEKNGTACNNRSNVCENGACIGSPCILFENSTGSCYCENENQLCHVCCVFDGKCIPTSERGRELFVLANYPCNNFTGYCTEDHVCKRVNNDILDNLRDILNFSSIWKWVKGNWYWVLTGFVVMAILIILLHVTYRRKKLPSVGKPSQGKGAWRQRRKSGVNEEEALESTRLLDRQIVT